eukprot:1185049-Prorocentrum_minimum.AAC.2
MEETLLHHVITPGAGPAVAESSCVCAPAQLCHRKRPKVGPVLNLPTLKLGINNPTTPGYTGRYQY